MATITTRSAGVKFPKYYNASKILENIDEIVPRYMY